MSKLAYGGILCLSANKSQLDKLQKVQNRVLRICFQCNRYTSNLSLHQKAKVLPLCLRRNLEIYKIMFAKMSNSTVSSTAPLKRRITRYGSSRLPVFDTPRSTRFLNTVTYQGPALWAALPNWLKVISDAYKFNTEIKKIIWAEFAKLSYV